MHLFDLQNNPIPEGFLIRFPFFTGDVPIIQCKLNKSSGTTIDCVFYVTDPTHRLFLFSFHLGVLKKLMSLFINEPISLANVERTESKIVGKFRLSELAQKSSTALRFLHSAKCGGRTSNVDILDLIREVKQIAADVASECLKALDGV